MAFNLSKRPNVKVGITMAKFCREAKDSKIPLPVIRAVDEVESAGSGFLDNGRPKILLERHYVYRIIKKDHGKVMADKAMSRDPSVCNPNSGGYIGGKAEYARIAKVTEICFALGLPDSIALRSCSWGRYQIMGDNFRRAGFSSVEAFVEAMFSSEDNHLEAFINYVQNTFLDDELQNLPSNPNKYATAFASGYNGPGYKRNNYHVKIPRAYERFKKQNVDCSKYVESHEHVVSAMPGIREVGQESGFDGTSLDDRYAAAAADDHDGQPPTHDVNVEVDSDGSVKVSSEGKSTPDNTVVIQKPEKVGFWSAMWKRIVAAGGTNVGFETVTSQAQQVGALGLSPATWKWIGYIVLGGTVIALIAFWWNYREQKKKDERMTDRLIQANSTEHNFVMLADPEELSYYESLGYKVIKR